VHGVLGNPEEGLVHSRRAAKLEPLSPVAVAGVGWPLVGAGRLSEAAAQFRLALDIDPNGVFPLFSVGLSHQFLGEPAQAVTVFEHLVSVTGRERTFSLALLGGAFAAAGRVEESRRILDELTVLSTRQYVAPLHFAFVEAQLGDTEAALASFERACDERNAFAWYWVSRCPLFTALRADARFARVLAKVVPG
jgi:tetratricopeptide (TPR) repeat protein